MQIANTENFILADCECGMSPSWNLHFIYSKNIITCGCKINSGGISNGDGWNPDSSHTCVCFGCFFDTHDNSIAVKSGKNPEGNQIGIPAKNIRIFDCSGGRCMALGSEMSGGVEDVYVWDCDFTASESGFGVKVTPKRGGYVRNSVIRNCRFTKVGMRSVPFNDDGEGAATVSRVENLRFENITLTGMAVEIEKNDNRKPCDSLLVSGLEGEENYFDNITFDGVTLERKDDGSEHILQVKNVKNFRMTNVKYE
jgi:polygalacturonase